MADVVPLPPDHRGRARPAPPAAGRRASPKPPAARDESLPENAPANRFVAPGVDRRQLRKLKRGDHTPTARLDLHGMTAAEAIPRVERFLETARLRHRCICIVHGRGLHSAGSVSVLRTRVRAHLSRHSAVLAFADAPPDDGGDGAVYVLLRR